MIFDPLLKLSFFLLLFLIVDICTPHEMITIWIYDDFKVIWKRGNVTCSPSNKLQTSNNIPVMQPGKRSSLAFCQSDSLIQLPNWLFTPPAGMGMVSLWFLVTITVLLSTRATSFGSVRASQLPKKSKIQKNKEHWMRFRHCEAWLIKTNSKLSYK